MTVRIKCQCGKPLPCPDHTGTDGDTIDWYVPRRKDEEDARGEE